MRVGDGGGDFQVDPAQLSGVAGELGRAYDDFTTVIADDDNSICVDGAAFGDAEVGQAWTAFNAAWSEELSLCAEALAEMVRNTSTTAQRYQENEDSLVRTFTRIGAA